jgi:hypothetical protein
VIVLAPPPVPLVSFARLPSGWHSFGGAGGVYATSWAYRPNSRGWATAMPRDGIVVQVFFPVGQKPRYPPLKLVLPRTPATLLEGTTDTPEYRIHGRLLGRNVEVWVDIRRRHPTKAALRLAQRVFHSVHAIGLGEELPGELSPSR